MVARAAARYGIDARIAVEQIRAESNFNPAARSAAGAIGIAQFLPATAARYGLSAADLLDPAKSIDAYARHMRDLLSRYSGDYQRALAAYNAGPGAVDKYRGVPPYAETRSYVQRILAAAGRGVGFDSSWRPSVTKVLGDVAAPGGGELWIFYAALAGAILLAVLRR